MPPTEIPDMTPAEVEHLEYVRMLEEACILAAPIVFNGYEPHELAERRHEFGHCTEPLWRKLRQAEAL